MSLHYWHAQLTKPFNKEIHDINEDVCTSKTYLASALSQKRRSFSGIPQQIPSFLEPDLQI